MLIARMMAQLSFISIILTSKFSTILSIFSEFAGNLKVVTFLTLIIMSIPLPLSFFWVGAIEPHRNNQNVELYSSFVTQLHISR